MKDGKWQWTDELVKEIVGKAHRDGFEREPLGIYDRIENFKASKQPKEPERIEVSDFYIFRGTETNRHIQFSINKEWPSQKTEEVKTAIEYVLNNEAKKFWELIEELIDRTELYKRKYTEKDLENAFGAGRKSFDTKPVAFPVFSATYPTFQSYLNTIKS